MTNSKINTIVELNGKLKKLQSSECSLDTEISATTAVVSQLNKIKHNHITKGLVAATVLATALTVCYTYPMQQTTKTSAALLVILTSMVAVYQCIKINSSHRNYKAEKQRLKGLYNELDFIRYEISNCESFRDAIISQKVR